MSEDKDKLRSKLEIQLKRFVPSGFERMAADLLLKYPVKFTITNPRSTKLGDYRPPFGGASFHRITVNGNLNPYSFLVTYLHEFAHLITYERYKRSVKPHGEEWKQAFRELLWPAVQTGLLPKPIEIALMKSMSNTKASSCTDVQLSRVLRQYDVAETKMKLLEELPDSCIFTLQGKTFKRGVLRRSRFECIEVKTGRSFLVHRLAEVEQVA